MQVDVSDIGPIAALEAMAKVLKWVGSVDAIREV